MFPCRYGRRNVVNLFTCVCCPVSGARMRVGVCGCRVGLLVQILDGGRVFGCAVWFLGGVGVWVTSPRPISTGRLGIAAVHLRPINPVVCGWPYPILWVGNLILKCASRLDAFSGYHVRT